MGVGTALAHGGNDARVLYGIPILSPYSLTNFAVLALGAAAGLLCAKPFNPSMCNLHSITKGQRAIIEFTRAMRDTTGNVPPMPGVFPDYMAPIVRNAAGREQREVH